ncbi:peptidoglycan-binding protein [Streptomyces sp. NPDC002476]|uniref:peptidoglycan-binding domain-containing protein n=1 Tax=Streptomyces sp. NPDC002476 TaxID=3364648 RepID=UPI0036B578C2
MDAPSTRTRRTAVRLAAGLAALAVLTGPAASLATAGDRPAAAPGGVGATAAQSAAADWPTLKAGSKGAGVTALQYLLTFRGQAVAVDASFGPATTTKVKAFRKAQRLTADGRATPGTAGMCTAPGPKGCPVIRGGPARGVGCGASQGGGASACWTYADVPPARRGAAAVVARPPGITGQPLGSFFEGTAQEEARSRRGGGRAHWERTVSGSPPRGCRTPACCRGGVAVAMCGRAVSMGEDPGGGPSACPAEGLVRAAVRS